MENREIILKHYISSPYKKDEVTNDYQKIEVQSSTCVDHLNIYIKLKDGVLVDGYFNGEACSIATSSCSILLTNVLNKRVEDIKRFIANFKKMCNDEPFVEEDLQEAIVFKDIIHQGNRKSCAFLPYQGLKKFLEEN